MALAVFLRDSDLRWGPRFGTQALTWAWVVLWA